MGLIEILTVIAVVLKAMNYVDWSWWIIFLPITIEYLILLCVGGFFFIPLLKDWYNMEWRRKK